jgi:DNA-binding transcriptional ArsR family regulator
VHVILLYIFDPSNQESSDPVRAEILELLHHHEEIMEELVTAGRSFLRLVPSYFLSGCTI